MFSTCFSDSLAYRSPDVLPVVPGVDPSLTLSEHGPSLVGGTITLDDASFATKIGAHRAVCRRNAVPAGPTRFVASGRQVLPLVGVADLEPDDHLRVAHAPLMRVPLSSTTAESQALPLAHLRYLRSQPVRINPLQLRQPRPCPRLPCSSA